jgi:hypothetical protein
MSPALRKSVLAVALAVASLPAIAAPEAEVYTATRHDTSRPLRELIAEGLQPGPVRTSAYEIPNILPKQLARALTMPEVARAIGAGVQDRPSGTPAPSVILSADGMRIGNGGGGVPPDTNGDVSGGANGVYIQWVNTSWATLDKTTGTLSTPTPGNSFWAGFGGPCQTTNDGDPIVLWDDRAERWVMSQFVVSDPGVQCFAVSTTADPLGSYHRYQFNLPEFGDYPHIGVWTDGGSQSAYLVQTHDFNLSPQAFVGGSFIAVERDRMLAGQPAQIIRFSGIDQFGFTPAHLEGQVNAPAGACGVFVHFDFETSEYLFWDLCANWANPTASTLSAQPQRIRARTPFVPRFSDAEQLGTANTLDIFGTHIMYRATTRAFPTGAPAQVAMVVNHVVEGPAGQGAIKWAQFNFSAPPLLASGDLLSDGFEPPAGRALGKLLADEGTFAPDNDTRWMGGIAIDRSGNIGLGYSVSSTTLSPQLRTTGRAVGDAAGSLRDEVQCTSTSTGSQTGGSGRWGDYASMSVDPSDECTFWFTSEYLATTSTSSWRTRVCSFRFADCGQPNFDLVADSATRLEICGTPTPAAPTYALRVGVYDGFNTTTNLSVTGLPGGANPSFSPASLTPPASSTLTLAGAPTLATGEYNGVVTATAGAQTRSVPISLGVSSTLPGVPTQVAPADAATGVLVRPRLSWNAVAGALSYDVEVATSAAFTQPLVASANVTGTTWDVNVQLASSTQFFWRVRARNYCGPAAYSTTRSFTTGVPGTCPAGTTLSTLYQDDFAQPTTAWTTDGAGGTAWARQTALAGTGFTAGTQVFRVPNNAVTSDRGLLSPPAGVAIPSGAVAAFLSFDAHYSFETDTAPGCWDGAAVEARVVGAPAFTYLAASRILTNGYNGVILAGAPLAGRDVWCRVPGTLPARSIVNLADYIGGTVQLRFRATSDTNTTAAAPNGMSIANLRIEVCQ